MINRTSRDKAEGYQIESKGFFFQRRTDSSSGSDLKSRPEVSKLSEKDQRAIFSAFVSRRISVETMRLCFCNLRAAMANPQTGAAVF